MLQRAFFAFALVVCTAAPSLAQGRITLEGRTVAPDGTIIGGVEISLKEIEEGTVDSVTSDDRGSFSITVRPGDYVVTIYKQGFTTQTVEVNLPPGQDINQDVVLQPSGTTPAAGEDGARSDPFGSAQSDEEESAFSAVAFDRRLEDDDRGSLLIAIARKKIETATPEDPDAKVPERTGKKRDQTDKAAKPVARDRKPDDTVGESAHSEAPTVAEVDTAAIDTGAIDAAEIDTQATDTAANVSEANATEVDATEATADESASPETSDSENDAPIPLVQFIDQIVLGLPKNFWQRTIPGPGNGDWSHSNKGRLNGTPSELIYLRFDYEGINLPSKMDLSASSDGDEVFNERISIERLDPPTFEDVLANDLTLPPIVVAGEEFIFTPRLKAPFDLSWSFSNSSEISPAQPIATERLKQLGIADSERTARARVAHAPTLSADQPSEITAVDPWGAVVARYDWQPILGAPSTEVATGITMASRWITPSGSGCVCGSVPTVFDWATTTLGTKPVGLPLCASSRIAQFQLPKELPAGLLFWNLSQSADRAVDPAPAPTTAPSTALLIEGSMNSDALWNGESTPVTFRIAGTEDPFPIRLQNHTPQIVSMAKGDEQLRASRGGEDNFISDMVSAREVGNFNLTYSLNTGDCPCTPSTGEVVEADRRFADTLTLLSSDEPPAGAPPQSIENRAAGVGLDGQRFRVEIDWADPLSPAAGVRGGTGQMEDSEVFYFFSLGDWRILVNIVDQCEEFNHLWVMHSATVPFAYTLRVIDIESGLARVYETETGDLWKSIVDTRAFDSCPAADTG